MTARKSFVEDAMVAFNESREDAIARAGEFMRDRNWRRGLRGVDLNNIYREISP